MAAGLAMMIGERWPSVRFGSSVHPGLQVLE
jgi:hypothetical protein